MKKINFGSHIIQYLDTINKQKYLPTRIDVNNAKELCTVISFISTRDKTSPNIIGLLEEQHNAINTPKNNIYKHNYLFYFT